MNSQTKKLQKRAENLWKDYCYLRDGKQCMVKKWFPHVKISHTNVFQVDHCFGRADHNLFLETSNGTVVCSACNMLKSVGGKAGSVARLIDDIVIQREGQDKYNEMKLISLSKRVNLGWSNQGWLEAEIVKLTWAIERLKKGND